MNDHRTFLTTHVGSLPRTEELKQHMFAREDGLAIDPSALDEQVARAVEFVVARQTAKPHAILFEAANPRHAHEWTLFETVKPPEGKILVPGVIECQSPYIEHP
jgi:methionine synthase II (cobalamin-independent)